MAAATDVQTLLATLGPRKLRLAHIEEPPPILKLDWPGLDMALPDGGLPRGVIELAAPCALGGATSVALAAVHAGQMRVAAGGWCAWIDPEATLHAPGIVAAGVALERLLVVHAPRAQLGKIAVKVVASGAFEVVVVDFDSVALSTNDRSRKAVASPKAEQAGVRGTKGWSPQVLVRKLALASEPTGATVLLLTNASLPRATPWPVALRLELSRPDARSLVVRVAKDRRGRTGLVQTVAFRPWARLAG